MMVTVLGAKGNMGQRYCSILNHLKVPFTGLDLDSTADEVTKAVCDTDKIIVAVPTKWHVVAISNIGAIRRAAAYPAVDILCEKPVATTETGLATLRLQQKSGGVRIFSVNQYAYLPEYEQFKASGGGRTYYNYFKHGGDGLAWDCFPMFCLANGTVSLNESSPIWKCRINGIPISIAGMDSAYIEMVKDFIGPMFRTWDLDFIESRTRKVLKWIHEEDLDITESQNQG